MPDPSPRKPRKLTERQRDISEAGAMVVSAVSREVGRTRGIVDMHPRRVVGDVYRREIARLWRVALRAVKEAIR